MHCVVLSATKATINVARHLTISYDEVTTIDNQS